MDTLEQIDREIRALPLPDGVSQVVVGQGSPQSRVVMVGHSPSATDDATGTPYSGPAGEILDELLSEVGLSRTQLYVTNLVKVWTFKEDGGERTNRTPLVREIKVWLPYLARELAVIQPAAIVALGSTAAQFFLGKDFKVSRDGGQFLPVPESSPFLKLAPLPEPWPAVMGLAQPSYLIHLLENAPENYAAARAALISALSTVKAVADGQSPQTAKVTPDTNEDDDVVPF